MEFPCGAVGEGSNIVTAAAQVAAMVWVQSLARELPHAAGAARKKKNPFRNYMEGIRFDYYILQECCLDFFLNL